MGTIQKGILGGFSGKVGSVVGGNWKGIDYMAVKVTGAILHPLRKQLEQQTKFALMMRFLQPMSALLEVSFKDYAIKQTGINGAFAYNFANAIAGAYPSLALTTPKCLSAGATCPTCWRQT